MKIKIFYSFFLLLSTISLLSFFSIKILKHSNVPKKSPYPPLEKLNPQETNDLRDFFKTLFFNSSFGYTIFGNKPMSIEIITLKSNIPDIENSEYKKFEYIQLFSKLENGWNVWNNHFKHLPHKNFSLISYPSILGENNLEISIINHKFFLIAVDENLNLFQKSIGRKLNSREILDEYIRGEGEVFQTIQSDHLLFGILLGYGRDNSQAFSENTKLVPFIDFEHLNYENMDKIFLPNFQVIENSKETESLRKNFSQQREQINEIYQSEYFLHLILEKIYSNESI